MPVTQHPLEAYAQRTFASHQAVLQSRANQPVQPVLSRRADHGACKCSPHAFKKQGRARDPGPRQQPGPGRGSPERRVD